jgi:hypothetical protein
MSAVWKADDPWWHGVFFYGLLIACMVGTPIVLQSAFEIAPPWAWTWGIVLGIFVDAVVLLVLGFPVVVVRHVCRWLNQ